MHPILAKAKKQFDKRMEERKLLESPSQVSEELKHRELQVAHQLEPSAAHPDGWLKVYYCPDCMWGHSPAYTTGELEGPNAREIGVIIKTDDWSPICPARGKEAK